MKNVKHQKNPYKSDTPEWQLFEKVKSYESLALSYDADAVRYSELAAAARQSGEAYVTALSKLDPSFCSG